jgi:diguanylate cyclase (GGDEF)-like protein
MLVAILALGLLAFWATILTQERMHGLSRAGIQTSGHLRAVQALGQIDTHTDLLEHGLEPTIVADLRNAQLVLGDSLRRMQNRSVVARERRLAREAQPEVRRLWPAIDAFLDAVRSGDEAAILATEDRMQQITDALQLRFNDVRFDPSQVLHQEAAAAAANERTVHGVALVLIPLGLLSVALCAWQLRAFRRRSEGAMRAALDRSAHDARTDELTGLANRRALLEDLERRAEGGEEFVLALADLNGFKHYNDSFGHGAGDTLLRRLGARLQRACEGRGLAVRLGGDEFCVLMPGDETVHEITALMQEALSEEGEGFRITSACGVVRIPEEAADAGAALRLADLRMYSAKGRSRTTLEQQMCKVVLRMLDARHPGLGDHVEEVAELAGVCAEMLGLGPDDIHDVRRAAQLHDIGKVAIPASIIEKPGKLTAEEWDFMRRHTLIGERILEGVPAMASVAALVRSSHERWDGTGYPDRLVGEQTTIGARIIAVADSFCAMTEDRRYRARRSAEEALLELRRCAGTQFDPAVVEAFIAAVDARAASQGARPAVLA